MGFHVPFFRPAFLWSVAFARVASCLQFRSAWRVGLTGWRMRQFGHNLGELKLNRDFIWMRKVNRNRSKRMSRVA
jgi:hypothetical protein